MKKIILNFILIILFLLITFVVTLSTIGIQTDKFNKLISNKISETKNINLTLKKIHFKIDPKELSLFLETQNPEINYRSISIPVQSIKVYIDFFSLFKSDVLIKKTSFTLEELDIVQLNELSSIIKPSNFKSLLNNKIKEGKLISEIEFFLNEKGELNNFIAKGQIKNLKAELLNNLFLTKTNLNFFADKNDILFKNIFGNIDDIKISDGDIKINLDNGTNLSSNFNSVIDLEKNFFNKHHKLISNLNLFNKIENLKANLSNNFLIEFDDTYKLKNYSYSLTGNISESSFKLSKPIKNSYITKKISEIYLSNFKIKSIFNPNTMQVSGEGKYSFNNLDFLKINLENKIKDDLMNLKLDLDYESQLEIGIINYKKTNSSVANIKIDLEKKKDFIKVNSLDFKEKSNSINVKNLEFKNNKFLSFKKISVSTGNNDFYIQDGKRIKVKGTKFDASNLPKFFKNQNSENKFKQINSDIDIDFKNIDVPLSERLQNFKLIGQIKKGKFVKMSAKGDFGNNNFLDITMKKNKSGETKYLEIYSDLTRPLLTEYSFFKGLSGGNLLFTSIIDNSKSISKLKIENFKVKNAPGVVKLLSLADLGGLADLAEGEGLSFDVLEIDMEKNKDGLKLNEILALGPSMSVLVEGYQDTSGLTSLRGTLVPAKTLNKMISKIPLIGDIVIPKEVGEGLFGISFKMKGPKGKIKTTINPIRTLTPRFIQKILDRGKKTK